MSAQFEDVVVTVNCPNCGSEGYEVDFTPEDIAAAATVSLPCDDCNLRIEVFVIVEVNVERPVDAAPVRVLSEGVGEVAE